MNKTYQELCDENQHLREGIRAAATKLDARELRVTVTTDPDLHALDHAINLSRTDRDDALNVAIKGLNAALLARNGRKQEEHAPPFRFARYRQGHEMAEGVTIENARTLSEATAKAARIAASEYPRGDVLVFSGAQSETSLARRDAKVAASAWMRSAKRLQQAIDYIEEKHHSNPNYPAVSYDAIAEYVVDMERYADKLRRQAAGLASE